MDFIVLILVLVLVALIALPIVAIATANSRARELRGEIAALISRIHYLEERLENLVQRKSAPAEEPRREPAQSDQAAPAPPAAAPPPIKVEAVQAAPPPTPQPEPVRTPETLHPAATVPLISAAEPQSRVPSPTSQPSPASSPHLHLALASRPLLSPRNFRAPSASSRWKSASARTGSTNWASLCWSWEWPSSLPGRLQTLGPGGQSAVRLRRQLRPLGWRRMA